MLRSPKTQPPSGRLTTLPLPPGSRLPTLRSPPCLGVQFKLFWFYYAQRRAGCPRSSPSPLRGKLMLYNMGNRPAVGCPPYDHRCFHAHFCRLLCVWLLCLPIWDKWTRVIGE
ncbi:MAG: hypothetical protein LBQ66_14670 [Planctomycetaceae bacterium]|nr:hypothetical protein [Planctomycetaceae bacterium]